MTAIHQGNPTAKLNAWHQFQQGRMTAARHAFHSRAMMLAKFRKCGLKQHEITQLLVKYGVASGHNIKLLE
jgi:hypothetical protein